MTTIYELEKQATTGPLELTETGEAGALFYELMIPDGESVCGFYHMPESRDLDNARLFKHCREHFIEALEEVKAWQAAYDAWLRADDPDTVEFPDSHALIKKLEAVE